LKDALALFKLGTQYELSIRTHSFINLIYEYEKNYRDMKINIEENYLLCKQLEEMDNSSRYLPTYYRASFFLENF